MPLNQPEEKMSHGQKPLCITVNVERRFGESDSSVNDCISFFFIFIFCRTTFFHMKSFDARREGVERREKKMKTIKQILDGFCFADSAIFELS